MASLTGYGGVGEIGGNAFLLDDGRSRLFLDFGKRFGNDPRFDEARGIDTRGMPAGWNDYFDDFLQPRGFCMARDLARLDLIPPDLRLYREDRGGQSGPAPVEAVLISHAHMDHCGLLGLLRPDIPILASAESRATMASLQATGTGVMNELVAARPKGILPRKDGAPGKGTSWKEGDEAVEAARTFDAGDSDVGDWRVRHYGIDHSIHGARGSIIEGRDVSLVYTGDFRMHGRQADDTKRFIERAGGVDVLVSEGTRVSRSHGHAQKTDDEASVEGEIQAMLDAAGDVFVAISYPPRDLDRFLSIWNVARRSGRRLVVPTKLAHLIDSLRRAGREDLPDPRADPHLAIHVPARGRGVLHMPRDRLRMPDRDLRVREVPVDDGLWTEFWLADHQPWEQPYLTAGNTVTSADVCAAPHAYLFSISYWTINELFDLFPGGAGLPEGNGLYIHSMTQPFNDEMEIGDRKLGRWLEAFRLERRDTHVSGHLSEEDLHWVLDEIGARILVPVHSQAPGLTAHKYEERTGNKALLAEPGKALDLRLGHG